MRALRLVAAFTIAVSLPALALAQSTDSSSQLSSLIAEMTQLEQQIATLTAATSSTPASSPAVTPSASNTYAGECPDLSENLSLGSSGSDVANLQSFLAGQGLFDASITAYYGPVTQTAVQQWQESRGIVTNGSPSTTGFGAVGPKTRAAIAAMCGNTVPQQQTTCSKTLPPTTECPTSWQPVTDANGCTMYYQCSIALPTGISSNGTTQTGATTTYAAPQACPTIQQPQCTGQVEPFQTNANGCVVSYECVI